MGGLLTLGIVMLLAWPAANEIAIVLIILFLVLPLVNGLWDWFSWWVSRLLGRDLLAKLDGPPQLAAAPGPLPGTRLLILLPLYCCC
jgi:hypothetical protein